MGGQEGVEFAMKLSLLPKLMKNTIPAHIRNKLNQSSEVETTQDLEKELKVELS